MNSTNLYDVILAKRLEIREKKNLFKQGFRPIRLFVIAGVFLIILLGSGSTVGAFFSNTTIGYIAITVAVLSGIAILFLGFLFYMTEAWELVVVLWNLHDEIQKVQMDLGDLEDQFAQQPPTLESYKERLFSVIAQYQREANNNRHLHYTIQITIILFSLLVSGLTSGLTGLVGLGGTPWLAPAFSLLVSFMTAIITLFRFHDRGYNLQETADAIKYEISCANLGIYDYENLHGDDIFHKLAHRAELLQNEQRKRQQQLEQSSQTKQPAQ